MRVLFMGLVFATSACSPSADTSSDPVEMNMTSYETDGSIPGSADTGAPETSEASAAYNPTGIVDRVELPSGGGIRSYVWLDTVEDTVVVELTDSSARQLKSGQQVSFGCGSVGLSQVGTTSYTRNAKDYTDCAIESVVAPDEADKQLQDQHHDAELGRALDSMAARGSDTGQ